MLLRFTFFFIAVCFSNFSQAQMFSVIAKHGLVVRDSPSVHGERITKIPMASDVRAINKTNNVLIVEENKQKIEGHWMEINYGNEGVSGYVFDGYLIPVDSTWQGQDIGCDPTLPCNSSFLFDSFEMIIFNYQTEEEVIVKGDTVHCYEAVFNEIGSKVIEIIPEIVVDSIQVFTTTIETISEQYNPVEQEKWDESKYVLWELNKAKWEGYEDFVPLIRKRNYFAIPATPYESQEKFRKQKMSLRDTLVDLSGESWNVATLVYHEKPCLYMITDVMIKVILYKNGADIEEKIVVVNLSYGC